MSDTILVYTTFDEKEDALKLARLLLEKKLIACAHVDSAVDAIYRWKGKIEQTKEYRLVLKSSSRLWKELEETIQTMHPYEIPEIVAISATKVSDPYQKWLTGELRQ